MYNISLFKVILNKDIQENFKKLEDVFRKQHLNENIPLANNNNSEKVNHAYEHEANTSNNFISKDLINESVQNEVSINFDLSKNTPTDDEIEYKKQVDKAIRKKNERIQILNELISTEKVYYYELNICYDTFMVESLENVR